MDKAHIGLCDGPCVRGASLTVRSIPTTPSESDDDKSSVSGFPAPISADVLYDAIGETWHSSSQKLASPPYSPTSLYDQPGIRYNQSPVDVPSRNIWAQYNYRSPDLLRTAPPPQMPCLKPTTRVYYCWQHGCSGRSFSKLSNYRRHCREKTNITSASCPRCGKGFSRIAARDTHYSLGRCRITSFDANGVRYLARLADIDWLQTMDRAPSIDSSLL